MDMIVAVSGGGEIIHPSLFLNLRCCKTVPGSAAENILPISALAASARGIVGDVRHGTHNPP